MGWFSDVMKVISPISNVWDPFGIHDENDTEGPDQEDVARQREEVRTLGNQYLSQLVPGSTEYSELQSEIERLSAQMGTGFDAKTPLRSFGADIVSRQQARITDGKPVTPFEARTNKAFQGLRDVSKPVPFEQDVLNLLGGQPTTTPLGTNLAKSMSPSGIDQELLDALLGGETTSPIGGVFNKTLTRANTATSAPYDDSVFKNALKLVEDRVNTEAAGRGTLGSGLRLESLGRAGVEASIAEAMRQDSLRKEQSRLDQEAYANAIGLYDTGRNVNAGVQDFNANLYNVGEGLRTREIGLEDALVNMQLGRETNLTNVLNSNTNTRLNDQNALLQRTTSQATADRLDRDADEAARRGALGQAAGTALGAGAFLIPGGAAFAPALMAAGGKVGSGLAGGRQATSTSTIPQTGADYLSIIRAGQSPSGSTSSPSLSHQPNSNLDFADLLAAINESGGFGQRRNG